MEQMTGLGPEQLSAAGVTALPLSETAKRRVRRARSAAAASGRWITDEEMGRIMLAIERATLAEAGIERPPYLRLA